MSNIDDRLLRLLLTDEEERDLTPAFKDRLMGLLDEVDRRVKSEEKVRWILEKPERIEAYLAED